MKKNKYLLIILLILLLILCLNYIAPIIGMELATLLTTVQVFSQSLLK